MDVVVAADVSGSVTGNAANLVNMRAFITALFVQLNIKQEKIKAGIVQFGKDAQTTLPLTQNKVKALVSTRLQIRPLTSKQ